MEIETRMRAWGIGWLLAFVVLFLCIGFWAFDKPLTSPMALLLIGLLALARIL